MKSEDKICILGIGFIGLTLASVLAKNGYAVNGVDVVPEVIKCLKNKKTYFFEPSLQELLSEYGNKSIQFHLEIPDRSCNYYIICVGTPIDEKTSTPNLDYLKRAVASLLPVIKPGDTVIFRSTVPVGTTRQLVVQTLEQETGLVAGIDFFVGFVPERTIEGNAIREIQEIPQIIGPINEKSREKIKRVFSVINNKIVDVPNIEYAEMCKLIDNTYRDVTFAYANQIAIITESLGLNYKVVKEASNRDYKRNDIPDASPGVGGACLTKDPFILADLCRKLDVDTSLITSARHINERVVYNLSQKVVHRLISMGRNIYSAKVFVMGLAFKGDPETSDIRFSTSLDLIEHLKPLCKNIYGFDSVANPEDLSGLGIKICDIETGFKRADAVIIMNSHPSHRNLDIRKLAEKSNKPLLFVDCWNLYDQVNITSHGNILYSSIRLY